MTSQSEIDFKQHSENIARRFLQTIVVVDDRAYFERTESAIKPTSLEETPLRPRFTRTPEPLSEEKGVDLEQDSSQEATEPAIKQAETPEETSEDRAHELNAKYLIESFAERGMVCAVLRPSELEVSELDKRVYPLAERSDIVMLDWVLHEDTEGKKITQMIAEMAKKSSEQHRVRLIVIYTGERGLIDIVDEIEKVLKSNVVNTVLRKDDFTVVSGAVRIAAYAKGNVERKGLSSELKERIVSVDQLPDKLISEFAEMTAGLVSNVALDSLAALRSNTHRVLSKLNPGMDAPFLAHRAMLPQPEDASNLLVHLVGSELTAVLEGNEVGKVADQTEETDVIKAWIEKNEAGGYDFGKRFSTKVSPDALDQLHTLLRKGVADGTLKGNFASFKNKPHKHDLTKKLCPSSKSASDLEHDFAVLTTLKSDYRSESKPPSLLPGTLLKQIVRSTDPEPSFRYWVCIQPICDSVRIKEKRSFPFLELETVTGNGKFELVLPEGKGFVHVHVLYRPYKLRMENFDPSTDGSQTVRGKYRKDGFYFTAKSKTRYLWIGELRFEQTQRIVNQYAAELSRVGLDESEWLRRWAL
jgi:hypothetical protein